MIDIFSNHRSLGQSEILDLSECPHGCDDCPLLQQMIFHEISKMLEIKGLDCCLFVFRAQRCQTGGTKPITDGDRRFAFHFSLDISAYSEHGE
jgi:hypothetical protein